AILELNEWYTSQGYVLAQVTAAPQVSDDGVATLIVAEGVIESIEVRYIDEDGNTVDAEGEPIDGRTHDYIVTREFETQPGDVFRQDNIQADLQRVFGLGIFDDVRLSLDPGDEDPRKVKVVVNIDEGNTGSVGAAVGFNLTGDIFGSISYQQDNLGGNNHKLRTEVQLSERDLLFDVSFTDPWIAGDPHRTSYTVNGFNRRSISLIFDGGDTDVDLPNGDTPRVNRVGGGVSFARPLDNGWSGSVGLEYQRVSIRDSDGDLSPQDQFGNDLSFSGDGRDDLLSIPIGFVLDRRNDPLAPTSGSLLRLGTEQTIPVGKGTIFFNRLRASYSRYVPVNFLSFGDGPQTLAFNVQGGTVLGDLPPYEAFSLGGTNSVRGFDEGDLGSGRSFVQATAEYRFPLFTSFLGGALFVDFGTDLGSGDNVPGDPAEIRGKPGSGFGYGAGLRVQTPLGALRLDYGINDDGDGRIHFGIGERF
ncbi:MAG: BamA/TamA family outer membrane protein, partial [Cyanobacteria bacterium P01_D01_bin.2]